MKILKANGQIATYDPKKIVRSLKRVGAAPELIEEVLKKTEEDIYEGMTTGSLYKAVFKHLKKKKKHLAGKYHLKKAIMELGPTGYPFESYVAALLEAEGYQTKTSQIVDGRCVQHEVDVVAIKRNRWSMFECKFHSSPGMVTDIKDTLYTYARFLDVKASGFHHGGIVTNTRLSSEAEKYAQCVGLTYYSWNSPKGHSLSERVDKHGLYPLTCITSLPKEIVQKLLNRRIVLCSSICQNPSLLRGLGLKEHQRDTVLDEVRKICTTIPEKGCCL